MYNLKERVAVIIPVNSSSTVQHINWGLEVGSISIYTGTAVVFPNQTTVEIDVTNILEDYRYKGEDIMRLEVTSDGLFPVANSPLVNGPDKYIVTSVRGYRVDTNRVYGPSKQVFFQHYNCGSTTPSYLTSKLTPHIPYVITDKFVFRILRNEIRHKTLWQNGVMQCNVVAGKDWAMRSWRLNELEAFDPETSFYSLSKDGEDLIAYVDQCPADYYVCWIHNGVWNSQPFNGRVIEKEEYSRQMLLDTNDTETIANTRIIKSYELNSDICSKVEYDQLKTILHSNWVQLYDTRNNAIVFINPIDSDMSDMPSVGGKMYQFKFTAREQQIDYE